ncbi:hypothetical protein MKA58_11795 [[Clostridium] innocuum]|nr:hypothetical protein [[Clostridium] innocuum]
MSKNEDPVKELEKAHQHWKDIYENGCFDPSWSDGVNLNLVRNHMFYYQRIIEGIYGDGEKPSIYYAKIPDKVDMDYMARKDEILERAADFYTQCSKMQEIQDLLLASDYLSEKEISELRIGMTVCRYRQLGKAILENDYVKMRNLSWNAEERLQDIQSVHERLMNRSHYEGEQLSLFEMKR